jgi:tetratricopeptide (TPR) repeat protein
MRLRIYLLISLLLGFIATDTYACGNEYFRTELPFYNKKLKIKFLLNYDSNIMPYWSNGFGEIPMNERWVLLEKMKTAGIARGDDDMLSWPEIVTSLATDKHYKLLSDYAWHEVRTGNRDIAVKLLETLYARHPDEYNILANLGTAYEVTGKNEKALEFLRKAVAINPQSHYGSEWIHIKILEQKLAAHPDYRLILDLKADTDPQGWLKGKVYDKSMKPDSLMVQLAFQLHERISFIAPPDPIVGQLVKDFADLVALTHSQKEAKEFYEYAVGYDSLVLTKKPPPIVAAVQPDATKIEPAEKENKRSANMLIYSAVGLLAFFSLFFIVIKARQRRV